MFAIVIIAFVVGFILILATSQSSRHEIPAEADALEEEKPEGVTALEGVTMDEFQSLCLRLLQAMGLRVEPPRLINEREFDINALNPAPLLGGTYIVHCIYSVDGHPVPSTRVIALGDTVKAERAAKGLCITNGYFAAEVGKYREGPPCELINAKRFKDLLDEYNIAIPA
jgi:hypothetical protein